MKIHPTAIISPDAIIEEGAEIGPYSIIRGQVKIGKGTVVENHVTIGSEFGVVEIGENNRFSPGSVIGGDPQDLTFDGQKTKLIIGNNNIIREHNALNLGTVKGGGVTTIGDNNMFMAYVHVAHDCIIGNEVLLANLCQLAGHGEVHDKVKISGCCGAIQFVRMGKHAYLGAYTSANKDILPFTIATGIYAKMRATNKIGLERAGYSKDEINNIHKAVKVVIRGNTPVDECVEEIYDKCEKTDDIDYLVDFLKSSKNGVAR